MTLATRLLVEEALEGESRDVLGREHYEHGASPGQGWRNNVPMGRLHTAEAIVDYAAPQLAGREEAFRSEFRESLKGNNQALEGLAAVLLAQGLSVRKEAGIEHVRLHDLRHRFASRALSLGESLPMIGKLLGHRKVQTTARYAHLARDSVKAAAKRVGIAWESPKPLMHMAPVRSTCCR